MSKDERPSTAPARMPNRNVIRTDQPEENENEANSKVLYPLCRKVACMNISVMDNVADNILESNHCLSSDPIDLDILRFEVVDIFARIKENCLEQEASIQYSIPLDNICITLLYPTLLKPLYCITRRFNGVLMTELEGAEESSVETLRDLLKFNRVNPDSFVVTNQSASVVPMDTYLGDLRILMQQYPKIYQLAINILPHKTAFFAKIYYRHKDEPELDELDFFTEYRVTTVEHATTLDRGKATSDTNTDASNPVLETRSRRRNRSTSQGRQVTHAPEALTFYPEEYEPNDDDYWEAEPVPPINGAPHLPVTTTADESDFLAGGDSRYAAMYQHGFATDVDYELYEQENQNQPQ